MLCPTSTRRIKQIPVNKCQKKYQAHRRARVRVTKNNTPESVTHFLNQAHHRPGSPKLTAPRAGAATTTPDPAERPPPGACSPAGTLSTPKPAPPSPAPLTPPEKTDAMDAVRWRNGGVTIVDDADGVPQVKFIYKIRTVWTKSNKGRPCQACRAEEPPRIQTCVLYTWWYCRVRSAPIPPSPPPALGAA